MADALLISIVRRPGEVFVLVSERDVKAEAPQPSAIKSVPLDRVSRSLYPRKERLQESWRFLARVTAADEDALYHVLIVAIETVPDVSAAEPLPLLPHAWGVPEIRPKATSAHPRAFKGTKHQPPKGARLAPFDIRPYLCDIGSIQDLLAPLRRFVAKVRARLLRSGYAVNILDAIEKELSLAAPMRAGKTCWTMPARFVEFLWPLLRWRTPRDVSAHLSLFVALELEKDESLLWSVTRLVAASKDGHACAWCRLAVDLPPQRRLSFLNVLLDVRLDANPPKASVRPQLQQVSTLVSDERFSNWVATFLETVRDGGNIEYLLAGFRLAAQFEPRDTFRTVGKCDDFPERTVEEIGIELGEVEGCASWLPMMLWERCGRLPGLNGIISKSAWRSFTRDAAYRYFKFFVDMAQPSIPEASLWSALRKHVPTIEALLESQPASYQEKAIRYLSDWLLWTCDEVALIRTLSPSAFQLARRLSAPPFRTAAGAGDALGCLFEMKDSAAKERFFNSPDRSFEAIERACRRDNDAKLIAYGLSSLVRHLETFTLEAFCASPKRLMRTARALGGVAFPVRADICQSCAKHALFELDPVATPIRETCARVLAACGDQYENPIPARLKSWYHGEIQLSIGSLQRYQRIMVERLLLTRLDLIEQSVLARLKHGLPAPPASKDGQHALRLLGTAQENRRGLRSFLNAYWSGNRDYLSKHPETVAWYRKHPAIPRGLWEGGIPFHSKHGDLTIQIERDPLEILKLGTYTGTCLAVGGLCSYSAVAALLDINKQVLYARDHRGRVVARQLLAIADDNRLVCFSVYPLSASPAVMTAFREYDRAFARALGIPQYTYAKGDDAGYQVSSVLSVYWWDDGSWDYNTTE